MIFQYNSQTVVVSFNSKFRKTQIVYIHKLKDIKKQVGKLGTETTVILINTSSENLFLESQAIIPTSVYLLNAKVTQNRSFLSILKLVF